MQKTEVNPSVVILGGGLLGLKTAHDLLSQPLSVSIVEKETVVGGLCRSFEKSGLGFDLGPHFYYTGFDVGREDVAQEYSQILGGELKSLDNYIRESLLYSRSGRYTYHPLRFGHILKNFGPAFTFSAGINIFKNRLLKRSKEATNAKEFMIKQFGGLIFDEMFSAYMEKSCGINPSKVSTHWVTEREGVLGKKGLLNFLLMNIKQARRPHSGHFYPESGGAGAIPLAYEKKIASLGGDILLGCAVKGLRVENSKVRYMEAERDGQRIKLKGNLYLSTLPLPDLVGMIDPPPPREVIRAGEELKFRGLILLYFEYPRELFKDTPQIYVGARGISFKRLSEPKRINSKMGPGGKTGVCFEICCDYMDETWNADGESLFDRCRKDVGKMGLGVNPDLLEGIAIRRIPHAYPIYDLGFFNARAVVLDHIKGISNLLTRGRQGEFKYNIYTYETFNLGTRVAREITGFFKKG